MWKQKEQKQIEKDTIQRKELRYGYLIPSDWNYEKMNQTKSKSESAGHRAWLEIDRKALEHNVCLFQRLLPDTCQLMPAVKAQAYGLGAVLIAKELNRLGIQAFCVASAEEGMELRKNGIAGEILILGYTAPEQFALLHTYQLTQTVVDFSYAKQLNQSEKPLHVHIAVDTGMHRIGERSEHFEELCAMFQMKQLVVDGIFSHLCVSDGQNASDQAYTRAQAECFQQIVQHLEEKGYADHIIELEESSATVQLAAEALGVEPGMIAKTMSFLVDGEPILILTEGTAKVDNRKYKDLFHVKAKMIPFGEVEEYIGHAPGGVCPFGIKEGITVYLDESLKRFETVYPAAGNDHSAVRLTIAELEDVAGACGWIDVCKEILL